MVYTHVENLTAAYLPLDYEGCHLQNATPTTDGIQPANGCLYSPGLNTAFVLAF